MSEQFKTTEFLDLMITIKKLQVKSEQNEYKNTCLLSIIKVLFKSGYYENVIDSFISDTNVETCFVYVFIEALLYKQKNNSYNLLDLYRRMRSNKVDKNTHSLLIR
jgi:hypothetical protein